MKVLLFLSQDAHCNRIVDRFEFEGYQIVQVASEAEALSQIRDQQIEIVVLDSEKTGEHFVTDLRSSSPSNYLYVFFMVSEAAVYPPGEDGIRNADEYIQKPVEPDELVSRIVVVNRYSQTLADIRSRQKYAEPIRDPITGTFSKSTILELINTEISRFRRFEKPFILALIILDYSEEIDSLHGKESLHKSMAQVDLKIWASVRAYDLIGRWSGNSFMLLMPETLLSGATVVAERLKKNISSVPLSLAGGELIKLSASMSIVQCSHNEFASREELIAAVEGMLKKSEKKSRNQTVISGDF